jgi:glutathione peroxidase
MTTRQIMNKSIYPILMLFGKMKNKKETVLINKSDKKPLASFYDLKSILNDNTEFLFEQLKGKKVLIVNTASNCGYTSQYDDLQKLSELYIDKLIILGFPSNDFGEQEKGDDKEIATFCKINFGVSFPLMQKSIVLKKNGQNEVYQWLTNANKNGWNNQAPVWNFCKYIINKEGTLTNYFAQDISPLADEIQDIISDKN